MARSRTVRGKKIDFWDPRTSWKPSLSFPPRLNRVGACLLAGFSSLARPLATWKVQPQLSKSTGTGGERQPDFPSTNHAAYVSSASVGREVLREIGRASC